MKFLFLSILLQLALLSQTHAETEAAAQTRCDENVPGGHSCPVPQSSPVLLSSETKPPTTPEPVKSTTEK